MKTCPYCGSRVEETPSHYYCSFCVMNLELSIVQKDGQRLPIKKDHLEYSGFDQFTTPELMCLSTIELLYFLKNLRKERSDMYNSMYQIKKVGNEHQDDELKEGSVIAGDMYEQQTRRMFVVENIIRERMGYVPTRLTEKYLADYLRSIELDEVKKGKMVLRK